MCVCVWVCVCGVCVCVCAIFFVRVCVHPSCLNFEDHFGEEARTLNILIRSDALQQSLSNSRLYTEFFNLLPFFSFLILSYLFF